MPRRGRAINCFQICRIMQNGVERGTLCRLSSSMLASSIQDPDVEFVAHQLKRGNWINDYEFLEGRGYKLQWTPHGITRMTLLQISLRRQESMSGTLESLDLGDSATDSAIRAFWDACLEELALVDKRSYAVEVFARIIKDWRSFV